MLYKAILFILCSFPFWVSAHFRCEDIFSAPEIEEVIESLNSSSDVIFFDGEQRTRSSFIPGESYTVVITEIAEQSKILVGRNTQSPIDGRIGGNKTHFALLDYVDLAHMDYYQNGGALRINLDGSIDISGYHQQTESTEAADNIEHFIRRALPNALVRKTAHRLSTFAPR